MQVYSIPAACRLQNHCDCRVHKANANENKCFAIKITFEYFLNGATFPSGKLVQQQLANEYHLYGAPVVHKFSRFYQKFTSIIQRYNSSSHNIRRVRFQYLPVHAHFNQRRNKLISKTPTSRGKHNIFYIYIYHRGRKKNTRVISYLRLYVPRARNE